MYTKTKPLVIAMAIAAAGLMSVGLSGCGGGGGGVADTGTSVIPVVTPPVSNTTTNGSSTTSNNTTTTASTDVSLTGEIADGLIQGATVCYDLNDNGLCDTGEPVSSPTNAKGEYTLAVPLDEAGKHAIIANIPATAIDQDSPGAAIGTAYTLKAPPQADTTKKVFVSPITTIVQEVMVAAGVKDPAAAIAQVKQQLGLTESPLSNHVAARSDPDPIKAADAQRTSKMTRIIVAVTQEVARTADASPAITPAQKTALISGVVLNNIDAFVEKTADPSTSTVADLGKSIVATTGITSATVAAQANIAVIIATATKETVTNAGPTPFVTIRDFRYTDANNWNYRAFTGDDVTQPDNFRYSNDVRTIRSAGVAMPFNRDQSYFDESADKWFECPSSGYQAIRYTPVTATADGTSKFCRSFEGKQRRTDQSIAGTSVRSLVERIRSSGLPSYDTWGPAPSALSNGSATFPAGAVIRFQVDTDTVKPLAHSLSAKVRVNKDTTRTTFEQWPFARSLDEMIAYYPGDLIDTNGPVHGGTTDALGAEIPDGTVADTTLQKVRNFRVAFKATSATAGIARIYQCRRNLAPPTGNGFTNCTGANKTIVMDTTYSITNKADARVLQFAAYPAEVEGFRKFRRLYVERAGAVMYGSKDVLQTATTIRLNKAAWDALRVQVPGVTAHVDPVAPVAVDAASWMRGFFRTSTGANIRFINSTGTTGGNFSEVRMNFVNDNTVTFARNALYNVNGVWKNSDGADNQCPSNGVNLGTWTANPRASTFCGVFQDASSGFDTDISGKSITLTFADMRLYGSYDNGTDFSSYGPQVQATDPESATFNGVFPSGSRLRYQETSAITSVDSFTVANPFLQGTVTLTGIGSVTAISRGGYGAVPVNGATTWGIYTFQGNSTPAANTTGQKRVRVSFDPAGTATAGNVKFWYCDQDSSNNLTGACVYQSDSTYTVTAVGGKNVLRFAAMPVEFASRNPSPRIFVEHNGAVYGGGGTTPAGGKTYSLRLNKTAYDVVFNAFGITVPTVTPVAP